MKTCHLCFLIGSMAFSLDAGVLKLDSVPPVSTEERPRIEAATRSLEASPNDLPALETIIACFPPDLFREIGTNVSERFSDPTRQAAWKMLTTFFPTAFLEEVLHKGSDDAASWALRLIPWQQMNSESMPSDSKITEDFLRRIIPALEKLQASKSERTSSEARAFIAHEGLLVDREKFLASLHERDEVILNKNLMQMMDAVRVDPHLTDAIYTVLARAKTENLQLTCLRYRWLFALPAWD